MKQIFIFFLDIYRAIFSSTLKLVFGGGCRFQPTCSEYAKETIEKFGALRGTGLSLKRLFKCRPFGGFGYDPVPEKL